MDDEPGAWPLLLAAFAVAVASCGGSTAPPREPVPVEHTTSAPTSAVTVTDEPPPAAADEDEDEPDVPPSPPAGTYQKIPMDVVAALEAHGEVHVIISLDVPSIGANEGRIDAEIREEIALVQARVLADLEDSDFRTRIAFDAVPAVAGTILSAQGLARLEAHEDVLAVQLDLGGGGDA